MKPEVPDPFRHAPMPAFGLVGRSGSGKTTLIEKLLPRFRARGLSVSTMKHAHHGFDLDQPGKDSWRHREAGAEEVMVVAGDRWALLCEERDAPDPDVDALIARMRPVDLLLIEGFRAHSHPKIEVYRPSIGKDLLWRPGSDIVAVASDSPLPDLTVPVLALDDVEAIADFITAYPGQRQHAFVLVGRHRLPPGCPALRRSLPRPRAKGKARSRPMPSPATEEADGR